MIEKLKPFGLTNYKSLDEYTKWMRDDTSLLPQSPHILNVNIIGAVRKKYGIQFCPECLADSSYFKSQWRFTALPFCTIHNTVLSDRCPHCCEPIYLTRTTTVLKNLNYCSQCWKPLTIKSPTIPKENLKFIEAMSQSVDSGWFEYDNINTYTPLFYKGFWRIIYAFYGIKGKQKNVWRNHATSLIYLLPNFLSLVFIIALKMKYLRQN